VNKHNYLLLWQRFGRSSLLVFTLPLLLINGFHQSLMPHDEGYYAMQARWIWETGDWLTPQWWGTPIYDRTIGIQWCIALAYHLFGLNEFSVRLPSTIACIASVLLTYEIGKMLFDRQIAWMGGAILMLMGLWVNEAHTAQQNTALVAIELLGIWALLHITDARSPSLSSSLHELTIQAHPPRSTTTMATKSSWGWGVVAGATVGWGFLLKGFMIFVPLVALLPYAIDRHRYRQLLTNPGIYLGLILGAIPTGLWLILSCYKYGSIAPARELIEKMLFLSQTDTYNPGPFYYLWMMPLNIFPWALFSAIGAYILWRRLLPLDYTHLSLSLGYPIALFILLSLFRTRMIYYTMQLLPLMALLAAVAFSQFSRIDKHESIGWQRFVTWLSYAFSGLGFILVIAGAIVLLSIGELGIPPEAKMYALPAIGLGAGWMTIPILWHRWQLGSIPYWLASWLVPAWFAIVSIGWQGGFADKSPDFRTAFDRLKIEQSIGDRPVNLFVDTAEAKGFKQNKQQGDVLSLEDHKTAILLSFYTPHLGKKVASFTDLPMQSYAWTLNISPQLSRQTRILGKVQGWQLIQKIGGDR
jgi:4-amino-4-deoxy-L-arabinose transferase-like glycosyltransferase